MFKLRVLREPVSVLSKLLAISLGVLGRLLEAFETPWDRFRLVGLTFRTALACVRRLWHGFLLNAFGTMPSRTMRKVPIADFAIIYYLSHIWPSRLFLIPFWGPGAS